MSKNGKVSDKIIGRLCLYRRLLSDLEQQGVISVFSHELGAKLGGTAAQVRQDLKVVGFSGSPNSGYNVSGLNNSIKDFLDSPDGTKVALVGIGNLGRALLSYFSVQRSNLRIVAAFDVDPRRCGRVIHGCRCYAMDDLPEVLENEGVSVAILAVPESEVQPVAGRLVELGVGGFLNFAPITLRVPSDIFVENIDMTMALEKVAFFARPENERE